MNISIFKDGFSFLLGPLENAEVGYYLSSSPSKDGKEFQMKEVETIPLPKKTNPISLLWVCFAKLQKEDCIKMVSFALSF